MDFFFHAELNIHMFKHSFMSLSTPIFIYFYAFAYLNG